jgi:hypothetical protein
MFCVKITYLLCEDKKEYLLREDERKKEYLLCEDKENKTSLIWIHGEPVSNRDDVAKLMMLTS